MTPLWVLTLGASLAVMLEFIVGLQWMRPSLFTPESYTWFRLDKTDKQKQWLKRRYDTGFKLKWVFLLLLPFGGWASAVGGLGLALWFLGADYRVSGRSHTALLGLMCAIVALGGPPGLLFPGLTDGPLENWVRLCCLAVACQMYLSTAVIKWKDKGFRSGMTLYNLFDYFPTQRERVRLREVVIPTMVRFRTPNSTVPCIYKLLAIATIATEILVPILLLMPEARIVGVALAVLMHLCFEPLLPIYLLPFMIASLTLVASIPAP